MNLDIHLNCSNTIFCTGNLKVHITKEVFQSLNICKYNIIIIGITSNQSTWDTCNHFLNRNTCSHKCHTRCTCRCHRCRSIRLKCLRYSADCIWEFLCRRKYRNQCTLCQCSMSNFTTSWSTWRLCFSNRVWWEVVMMHVTFYCYILIQTIYLLYFRKWC